MNISFTIKIMSVCLFIILAGHAFSWANDPNTEARKNYFKRTVEGDVILQQSTNDVLRDGVATNTLKSLEVKGYHLKSLSESRIRKLENMMVKTLEFDSGDGTLSQRFQVSIVESKNGRDKAMDGLVYLMASSSNMLGVRFKQFKNGPGDICFVNKKAEPDADGRGLSVLFFCRDNIAVMIIPFSQSNILPFARLIDSSIMMTSGKNQRVGHNEVMSQQSTNEIVTNNLVVPQLSTNSLTK